MPYITPERREAIEECSPPMCAGELNYEITMVVLDYMKRKGLCYQTINDVIGALSGASAEFYRRVAAPYEDKKILENSDVYPKGG